jgi:hypothetical protein
MGILAIIGEKRKNSHGIVAEENWRGKYPLLA